MSDAPGYLLNNQQSEAGERFDALCELFNASTFRHLEKIGIDEGWRVWEVGAGGPSIPSWLGDRVGSTGYVVATDIDTSWLDSQPSKNYEVQRGDIAIDAAPPGSFDLVHARLVLVHVPERERAIDVMINALRPGGWLVLEEADPMLQDLVCPDEFGIDQQLANKLKSAFRILLSERNVDLSFGRTLARRLRTRGLIGVEADAYFPMGGSACNDLERATILQVQERLIASGLTTKEEIARHLANVADGRLDLSTSPMISAWGQKPKQ